MKKVLIAVDDTKHSKAVLSTFYNSVRSPEEVVLLHVKRPGGKSLMYDMIGDAEMSTLKESLKGTEHQEAMDKRAGKLLDYYKKELAEVSSASIRGMAREGHAAEEILKVAEEEGVDLIILGHSGRKGLDRLIAGSVARDVQNMASMPVLVAKRALMCEEPYRWSDAYEAIAVFSVVFIGLLIFSFIVQNKVIMP